MRALLKSFFSLSLKIVAVVILTLLLLEGGVRIVLYFSLNNYFTKTLPQPYGRIMRQVGHFVCFGAGYPRQFDPVCYYIPKWGFFRGPKGSMDWPKEKEDHEIRIICIGNSTTYGIAVDYYHSWTHLLERSLAEKYPEKNIRVLNAGIAGASPKQVKRIFQFYLVPYHPDIVIYRGGSMLSDTYLVNPAEHSAGLLLWRCLYEFRIFRVVCALLDKEENRKEESWLGNDVYDFFTKNSSRIQAPSGEFDSDFSMVKRIALEHGARYALQVEHVSCSDDGVIHSEFEGRNRRKGTPVVYTLTAFQESLKKDPSKTLFVDNVHLTETGEAITAEEIFKFIINNKWIESFP